jgi:hypothetical protein
MKILGINIGGNDEPVYNPVDARLAAAETYVESQWTSGLTRHYDAQGVIDSVQTGAGVTVTPVEAVSVVERVRSRHGWPTRPHSSYFPPPDDEE